MWARTNDGAPVDFANTCVEWLKKTRMKIKQAEFVMSNTDIEKVRRTFPNMLIADLMWEISNQHVNRA